MKKFCFKKRHKSMRLQTFLWFGLVVVVLGITLLFCFLIIVYRDLPSLDEIEGRRVSQSTKIYDREGKVLLYEISAGQKRTIIPLEDIPQFLKDATIVTEDEKFYETPGFDWRAIIRAALVNLRYGRIVQGGSTISQQLAKSAFLTPEQTFIRKIKEFILAIQLNRHYSKDKILTLYLNEIPYGPTAYGIEAASRVYFGKSAKELTLAESALLAAIPRAPSYYSPWGSHTKELFNRQQFILNKMFKLGKIDKKQLDAALNAKLTFQPRGRGILAPHFVMEMQEYLVKKYGEEMVRSGGLTVKTTLNWDLQKIAERVVGDGAKQNEELYQGKNAALVAEDPKTGQILAMVGSRNYFDIEHEGNFNVATQGLRQPGSALKPFVYLTAFEKGYGPDTVIFDAPTEFVSNNPSCPAAPDFQNNNPHCFHPQNFDEKFRGPVSFRQALGQSINIPAVRVLYLVGLNNAIDTLHNFGVSTLTAPNRYGLSLVLGGGEVKLTELIEAYSVLSQEGVKHDQVMILEVKNSNGQILESYTDKSEQVAEPQYARLINDVLSDIEIRTGLFGASLPLTVFPDYDVALKTGTSNDYRDAWAFGYTPSLTVGVWAGNNDNTPMQKHGSSILAAVPIWNKFMVEALKNQPTEIFTKPEPISYAKPILAGDYLNGNQIHSILYYIDRKNPTGPSPQNPEEDPQFLNWESAVLLWAVNNAQNLLFYNYNQSGTVPVSPGLVLGNARPTIAVYAPQNGTFISGTVNVNAHIISSSRINRVIVYFNGQSAYEPAGPFLNEDNLLWSFNPQNILQQNLLEIEAIDQNNIVGRASVIMYR
jgi:1A family penicillin-binding protein